MKRLTGIVLLVCLLLTIGRDCVMAQTRVQRGVVRMITRSATDPIVPVQGVQVVVGNVAANKSDKSGKFSMNIVVNKEQSYQLEDVRVPQGSKLVLASPSRKKKLFLDNNDLEVSLISQDEKNMVSRANYKNLLRKYNEQAENVRKLREKLEEEQLTLDENSKEYAVVKAKRDSVQKLLNLYYDDKIYEQTLKDLESIAEDLALTDYQSLDSLEAHIYNLKMQGDWATISDVLIRLMGGNASAWLHEKLDRRNQAAKDFAMGMEMIKEAIEAFKMQHLNDSVSYYYEILVRADSTNFDNLCQAGLFEHNYMARYARASNYFEAALRHAKTEKLKATSYNNLGAVYYEQGDYAHSEEYNQKAMKIQLAVLGDQQPDVAISYNNLGNIYDSQGDYNRAEEYHQKALKIRLAELGDQHPDVANSYNNLGYVYYSQGDYDRAEEYYQKALKIRLAVLGNQHPDVATSYNNLGNIYDSQGDYNRAEEYYQKALKIQLAVFGDQHPNVATSYNNLGGVYDSQGDYNRAEEYYQKALNIQRAVFGDRHPNVATSYNNLGSVYVNQGDYVRAEEYYQKALNIQLAVLGNQHPNVAISYGNLGVVYHLQNDYGRAEEYYQKALNIRHTVLGDQHPDVVFSYNALGLVYDSQGDYSRAEEYYRKALDIRLSVLGENNPDVADSYNNIGLVYSNKGDYSQALEYFQKALSVLNTGDQEDQEELVKMYNVIGGVYLQYAGSFKYKNQHKAIEQCTKALEYYQKAANKGEILTCHTNIVDYYCSAKQYDKALERMLDLQNFAKKEYGEDSPVMAAVLFSMGEIYQKVKDWDKALDSHNKALNIRINVYGENHKDVAKSYIEISLIYDEKKNKAKALEYMQKAYDVRKNVFGLNHRETRNVLELIDLIIKGD